MGADDRNPPDLQEHIVIYAIEQEMKRENEKGSVDKERYKKERGGRAVVFLIFIPACMTCHGGLWVG